MKKTVGILLGIIFALGFAFNSFASGCETYSGSNINAQNYSVWANTVKSHLHLCSDGRLMKVQYLVNDNKLLAQYYDSSFNLESAQLISLDYSVYGGFYAVGDTYFVLTGQNNPSQSSSVTCFAITKYDKNWRRVASAELKDCNTTVPFDAGSARFCHSGNYLLIRTSHEMYRADDGLNHQANVTIELDMNSMKITDSFTAVMNNNYGYVSHSFNQFIKVDSDKIVAVDHGDAYPRSIVLTKYKTSVSSGKFTPSYYQPCTTVDLLKISGTIGANRTDCSVGGFEISSSGYLAALNSAPQGSGSSVRNIYVSYCDKDSSSAQLKQITSYSSPGVSTPHLVRINENKFIVLWCFDGSVYYCETDGRGNMQGDIMSLEGALSDCQPIAFANKLVWYCWDDNETVFYTISLSDLSQTKSFTSVSGHDYAVTSVNDTTVSLSCSKCNGKTTGKIPSAFELWWEDLSFSSEGYVYYNSIAESSYHPGDSVALMAVYNEADFNDYEVVSDKESVAKITEKYNGFAVTAMGDGTAKITVRSKYNHDINETYTFKVSHSWQVKEKIEATCDKDGKTVKVCGVCGESDTQTVKATGHKMSAFKTVTEATCKAEGKKKSTCSVCGYYETESVAKKDHDKNVILEAIAPTCTKSGKTEGNKCSVCGTVIVAQQNIDALGHSLGEYKTTKKPTCKAMGEETATCKRCSYTKTRDVERIPHTEVTVKAVAPTCTKSGKTEGKKCSVCDKVTVEPETVEKLGHSLGEYKITKKPTCKAMGEETATCKRCDYTKTRDVERAPHTEVTVKAVAPTCTKSGATAGKKCSVCDKITVEPETVEKLGHSLGEYKITKKPTCKAMGEETANCTRCSYTKTRDVERIPHTEVTVKAVAPTCTKSGKTEGKKCSVCDKVTVEPETVEKLGHSLDEYKITKKPTCKAMGEETATCKRCDYTKTRDVERAPHTEVTVKAVAPTCTKSGKTEGKKCSVCDKVTVEPETVEKLGHSLGEYKVTKKPTCKAMGEETATCKRCDYTKTRDVERAPHTEVTVKAVAPTCTNSGKTEGKKCSVCDKVTVEPEIVEKLGHEFGEYQVTKEATCSAEGEKTAVCSRCSYSKTADIEKLEHKEVSVKAVKATCTKTGKTSGKKCSLCGKITVAQKTTEALGHSKKITVVTKATNKANGKISTVCETCGKDYGQTRVYRIKTVELSSVKYAYDGKTKSPKVKITDYNKDQLIKDEDYTVTYQKGRKLPGKYSVKVKFKGRYSGEVTLYFEIKLSKVDKLTASVGTAAVTLKWKEVKGADGYQIYYSTSKDGKYKKLKSTSKLSFKKTGLKSGKTYYFKVRAYKKLDSGTVFGSFSSVKSAKIK